MKQALLTVLFAGALLAQTATKSTGAKSRPPVRTAPRAAVPAGDLLHPATLNRTAPAAYRVKFTTTKGEVVIEVTRSWAPHGADRFYNLVRAGYFTDSPFQRVIPNFMAQFGISARPDVNRAFQSANIPDDPHTMHSNRRGMVTFATTGSPNSRGTQLFINTVDNGYLDNMGFIPIGEVIDGMGVVDMLYSYGDTSPQQPNFEQGGKAFVQRAFPKMDRILTAAIVPIPAAPATPPPAAAAK